MEAIIPKTPSKVPFHALVESVEASSTVFAEKATALSEVIAQVNTRLQTMPGKLETIVGNDGVRLSFGKFGGGWSLLLYDGDSEEDIVGNRLPDELTGVSIARKARAFPWLPRLLIEIDEKQRQQVMEIEKAFESLAEMGGKCDVPQ